MWGAAVFWQQRAVLSSATFSRGAMVFGRLCFPVRTAACNNMYLAFVSKKATHHRAVLRVLQVVDPVAAAQPAARSKDLMRAMKEAAQGMRGGREVRFCTYCHCMC
jgi:hypothetical protein